MTPRAIFDRMRARWLANQPTYEGDLLADDVVIETPFAAPGRPTRTEGKQQVLGPPSTSTTGRHFGCGPRRPPTSSGRPAPPSSAAAASMPS